MLLGTYRFYTGHPTYSFGHGLSYTEFSLKWRKEKERSCSFYGKLDQVCLVEIQVANIGKVQGDEVVQVFMRPRKGSLTQFKQQELIPLKELLYYERVSIDPGSSRYVKFVLKARQLGLVDDKGSRKLYPGTYDIIITRGHGADLLKTLKVTAESPIPISEFHHRWW